MRPITVPDRFLLVSIAAGLCGMSRQRTRLRRGLRAAVHDDPRRTSATGRNLCNLTSLRILEQDSLAGRSEHEQPIEPTPTIKLEQRLECI